MSLEDPDTMRQWIRLNREQYHGLLELVTPLIKEEDTNMRDAVTPGEHLILMLRYLPAGNEEPSVNIKNLVLSAAVTTHLSCIPPPTI